MKSIANEDDLNDPLFDPPYDKSVEPADEDGYNSDEESFAGKVS